MYPRSLGKLRIIDKLDPSLSIYPITRLLYIYADAKASRKRPEVEGFVNYYLTYVNKAMYSLGYFQVKPTVANKLKIKFLQVKGNQEFLKEAMNKN